MTMWLAPGALALLLCWRFCFAFLFAFRCFVGSADAGSLFLPDTFRKQMVRGGFCAKKDTGRRLLFREKTVCSFPFAPACLALLGFIRLVLSAWSCPLGLVRLACFNWYAASVFSIACNTYISLIEAWRLYNNGTPALLLNAFPIGERRPE